MLNVTGTAPTYVVFVWGDGAVTTQSCTTAQCVLSPTHSYTVKGNYTLWINATDSIGSVRSDSFRVSAWTPGYSGAFSWSAIIEGYGRLPSLKRQTQISQPITLLMKNTGSTEPTSVPGFFTVYWFRDSWAASIATHFPSFFWPIGTYGMDTLTDYISTPGNHTYWATTIYNVGGPVNVTSPRMTVQYVADTQRPIIQTYTTPVNQFNVSVGQVLVVNQVVQNTGYYTETWNENWQESVGFNGGLVLAPLPLSSGLGVVINGTMQHVDIFPAPPPAPYIVLGPGESITLQLYVIALAVVPQPQVIVTLTVTPTSFPQTTFTGAAFAYPIFFNFGGNGAAILTQPAVFIANGTEKLQGSVLTIPPATNTLNVYFLFWPSSNSSRVNRTSSQVVQTPSVISFTVSGLTTNINYSFQIAADTLVGTHITGAVLTFVNSPPCVGANCGAGGQSPANFIGAILFYLAAASGIPIEIFGYFLGMALIGVFLIFMFALSYSLDVEPPAILVIGVLWLLIIVNCLFFFWPSWVIALMFVFTGVLLWREFSSSRGSGSSG